MQRLAVDLVSDASLRMQMLDRASLLQFAGRHIGSNEFGATDFYPALDALLSAINSDTRLTHAGLQRTAASLVLDLQRRAILYRFHGNHPHITSIEISKPTIIAGFPRTGTTLLHRLLASHPAHRAIRLWELRVLVMPRNALPNWQQSAIDETQRIVERMAAAFPALADMHPVAALEPDECNRLMRNSFATMFHGLSFYVPGYVNWLLQHSMQHEHAYHRLQLQAILSQRPGKHLILKDPCHSWHLDAIAGEYSDATFIFVNRDSTDNALSLCRLCRALWSANGVEESAEKIGPYVLNLMKAAAQRMQVFRESYPDERIIEVDYREFVRSPIGGLERICRRLGRPLNDAAIQNAHRVTARTHARRIRPEDSLATYGLAEDDVRSALVRDTSS